MSRLVLLTLLHTTRNGTPLCNSGDHPFQMSLSPGTGTPFTRPTAFTVQ